MQNWNQWQLPTATVTASMPQPPIGYAAPGADPMATMQAYLQYYNQPAPSGYTAEQWAAAQQQNWVQWQTWQQQYQQWQAQYGEKYQETMKQLSSQGLPGLAQVPSLPVIQPPPLPKEDTSVKPPLPPDIGAYGVPPPHQNNLPLFPSKQSANPPLPPGQPPDSSQTSSNDGNLNGKRGSNSNVDAGSAKKLKIEDEELTAAEKRFDAQFKKWEEQFNNWKQQNANHPDKTQYKQYEAKWTSWREKLIERREQMRRKRDQQKQAAAKAEAEKNKSISGDDKILNILSSTENQGLINNLLGIGKTLGLTGKQDAPGTPTGQTSASSAVQLPAAQLPVAMGAPAMTDNMNQAAWAAQQWAAQYNAGMNMTNFATGFQQSAAIPTSVGLGAAMPPPSFNQPPGGFGQPPGNFNQPTGGNYNQPPPGILAGGPNMSNMPPNMSGSGPNFSQPPPAFGSSDVTRQQSNSGQEQRNSQDGNRSFRNDGDQRQGGSFGRDSMGSGNDRFGFDSNRFSGPPPNDRSAANRGGKFDSSGNYGRDGPNKDFGSGNQGGSGNDGFRRDSGGRDFSPSGRGGNDFRSNDRMGGDNDRFGSGFGRDHGDRDRFDRDGDRQEQGTNRFGSDRDSFNPDRFNNSGDRFGSNNDRFGSGNDRFGSGNDRFGSGNDRFGSGKDRSSLGNDQSRSSGDRFGTSNDRFGSASGDRFGSSNDRPGIGGDRSGQANDKFSRPPPDRFDTRDGSRDSFGSNPRSLGRSNQFDPPDDMPPELKKLMEKRRAAMDVFKPSSFGSFLDSDRNNSSTSTSLSESFRKITGDSPFSSRNISDFGNKDSFAPKGPPPGSSGYGNFDSPRDFRPGDNPDSNFRGPGDFRSRGPGDFNPRGPGDFNPRGPGDFTSRGPGDFNPRGPGDFPPRGNDFGSRGPDSSGSSRRSGDLPPRIGNEFDSRARNEFEPARKENDGQKDKYGPSDNQGSPSEKSEKMSRGAEDRKGANDNRKSQSPRPKDTNSGSSGQNVPPLQMPPWMDPDFGNDDVVEIPSGKLSEPPMPRFSNADKDNSQGPTDSASTSGNAKELRDTPDRSEKKSDALPFMGENDPKPEDLNMEPPPELPNLGPVIKGPDSPFQQRDGNMGGPFGPPSGDFDGRPPFDTSFGPRGMMMGPRGPMSPFGPRGPNDARFSPFGPRGMGGPPDNMGPAGPFGPRGPHDDRFNPRGPSMGAFGPRGPGDFRPRGPSDFGPRGPSGFGPRDSNDMQFGPRGLGDRPFGPRGPLSRPFGLGGPNDGPFGPGGPNDGPFGPGGPNDGPFGPGGPNDGPFGPGGPNDGPFGPDGPSDCPFRPRGPNDGPFGPGGPNDGPFRPRGPNDGPFGPGGPNDGPFGPGGPNDGPFGPRGPNDGPCSPNDGPCGPNDGSFRPRGPNDGPFGPRGPNDGPFGPRGPNDGPFGPRGPNDGPFGPRGPNDGSFGPRGPNDGPFGPRGPSDGPFGSRGPNDAPFGPNALAPRGNVDGPQGSIPSLMSFKFDKPKTGDPDDAPPSEHDEFEGNRPQDLPPAFRAGDQDLRPFAGENSQGDDEKLDPETGSGRSMPASRGSGGPDWKQPFIRNKFGDFDQRTGPGDFADGSATGPGDAMELDREKSVSSGDLGKDRPPFNPDEADRGSQSIKSRSDTMTPGFDESPAGLDSKNRGSLSDFTTRRSDDRRGTRGGQKEFCVERQFNYNHSGGVPDEIPTDHTPAKVIDYAHAPREIVHDYVTPAQCYDYEHGRSRPIVPDHEIYSKQDFRHWVENEHNLKDYTDRMRIYESDLRALNRGPSMREPEVQPVQHRENTWAQDDRRSYERDRRSRNERSRRGRDADDYKDRERERDNRDRVRLEREREWERISSKHREDRSHQRRSNSRDRTRDRPEKIRKESNKENNKDDERSKGNVSGQESSAKKPDESTSQNNSQEEIKNEEPTAPAKTTEQPNSMEPPKTMELPKTPNFTMIDDLLCPPGRQNRPPKIVIILRGPPGSGKSFIAKLIKDKEVEQGGSAPRILSLDDYFLTEKEIETVDDNGKKISTKEMVYEYEEAMESSYITSLIKAFKKNITDGFFNFIILDSINEKISDYEEMWSFAKTKGFRVYVCEMEMDVQICLKRNIHKRTEDEVNRIVDYFEPTPSYHQKLDVTSMLQEESIEEVHMEDSQDVENTETPANDDSQDSQDDVTCISKWERMEADDKLDRLDGLAKRKNEGKPQTMEDFLQVPDYYNMEDTSGKKRVRWADLEERKEQEKMRAVGFVVGQTNWDRMMDPTKGGSALTRTKYI